MEPPIRETSGGKLRQEFAAEKGLAGALAPKRLSQWAAQENNASPKGPWVRPPGPGRTVSFRVYAIACRGPDKAESPRGGDQPRQGLRRRFKEAAALDRGSRVGG